MDLDGLRTKRRAELLAQLEELKSELKKLKEEPSPPRAGMEKLRPFLLEAAKKQRAELREAYRNCKPPVLDLRDPPCASPPGLQNDVDRESMVEGAIRLEAHAMDRNIGNAGITGDGEDEDTDDVTVDKKLATLSVHGSSTGLPAREP